LRNQPIDWRDSLFEEKTYNQLVLKAWRPSDNKGELILVGVVFVLLAIGGFATDVLLLNGRGLGAGTVTVLRAWTSMGFSFASAMLAFLLAGFTIFATVTKASLFQKLAKLPHPGRDINRLKFIFFTFMMDFFMMDFWHFIAFLGICFFVAFVFAERSPATNFLGWLLADYPLVRGGLIYFALGIVGAYMVILLLATKSFVWNIYQAILISIADESLNCEGDE
jgi:hypothetical protein